MVPVYALLVVLSDCNVLLIVGGESVGLESVRSVQLFESELQEPGALEDTVRAFGQHTAIYERKRLLNSCLQEKKLVKQLSTREKAY